MSTKLTLAGVLNAHSKELEQKIIVAKATEATHRGKGRLQKEGRSKPQSAVSKETAKARKRKAKKKDEERERSKERAQTRKQSTSCKKGSSVGNGIEAQSGLLSAFGMDMGSVVEAIGGLSGEVDSLGDHAGDISSALKGLSEFANKFDHGNVGKIGESLEGLDANMRSNVVPLASKLVEILEKLEKRTNPSTIKEKLQSILPGEETVSTTITCALVLSSIYASYTDNLRLQSLIAGISIVRALMTGNGVFHAAFSGTIVALQAIQLADMMPTRDPEIEVQGGIEKPLYAIGTIALVSSIFGIGWAKSADLYDLASRVSAPLARFDSVKKGWRSFVDSCLSGLQNVINWISKLIGKDPIKIKSDPYFFLEQYVIRVHALRDQFMSGIRDQSVLHQCNELYAEAEKVINELRSTGGTDLQIRDVVECKKALNGIMTSLGSMNIYSSGQRTAPVTILLTGAPGVGKTTLMNWAWPVVAARILPKDKLTDFQKNRGNYMYAFNQADRFYSGYRGQQHMLIDEFGFTRDSATGESVFSELIMMNNNNPYVLNMAALEDKGRYHFRSEVLWLTSNRESFRPDQMPSVQEPEAVLRRLEYAWCVCVKPEWSTKETESAFPQHRRLDKIKMRKHLLNRKPNDELFPHIQLHKMRSVRDGDVEKEGVDVDAFIDNVVDQYTEARQEGADMLKMVQASVDEIIDQRMKDEMPEEMAEKILAEMLNQDFERKVKEKLEAQAGESHETRTSGCVCASCKKIPIRATFDNFVQSVNIEKRFDGNRMVITDRDCKDKSITRAEFDAMFQKRMAAHVKENFANLAKPEEFYDRCVSLEARGSCSEAAKLFIDTMLSNRVYVSWMDFGNRNYIGSKLWLAGMMAGTGLSWIAQFAIIYAIVRAVFIALSPKEEQPDVRSHPTEPETVYTLRRPIVRQKKNNKELGVRGVEDVMKSIVRSNCYRADCVNAKTGVTTTGMITMVRSQVALLPSHILDAWVSAYNDSADSHLVLRQVITSDGVVEKPRPAGQNVYLRNLISVGQEGSEKVNFIDFKQVGAEGDDSVIVFMPEVRRGKDIVKHFLSKTYHIPAGTHSYFCGIDALEHNVVEKTGLCSYTSNVSYEAYQSTHAILSSYSSKRGDCGTLVGVISTPAAQAVYGIHVAGSPRNQPTAYAIRVCKEDLIDAISELCKDVQVLVDNVETCVPPATQEIVVQGGQMAPAGGEALIHVATAPRPIKSTLKRSPLFGQVGFRCTVEPANLERYNGIDALEHASLKYNMYVRGIPPFYLDAAARVVQKMLNKGPVAAKYNRVLTVEEAVRGIPGERFMGCMPRRTSAGLPWKMIWPKTGKLSALGEEEEVDLDSKEMRAVLFEVQWCLQSMKQGIRPLIIFSSFLKDELRPFGKAARLISSAPFHFSILVRQYFMGFSEHIMSNRVANGIAVGINPMSDEWTLLGNRHKGQNAVSGDIGNFDCGLEPNLMRKIKDIIHAFYCDYGTEDYQIREILFDELIYSRHAFGSAVYEWTGCNPSGNPLTVIINSIASLIMAYSAVNSIDHNKYHHKMIEDTVIDDVNVTTYGDDILISSYSGDFTFQEIRNTFAGWDIKFTDEHKSEGTVGELSIFDVGFLKRGFLTLPAYSKSKIVAPLAMETILNSIQWMRKTDHTFEDFASRVNTMLIELAAHGEDKYNFWQRTIVDASMKTWVGPMVTAMPWKERFELYLSTDAMY